MNFDALSNVMKNLPKPATPSPGRARYQGLMYEIDTANFDKMNAQLSKQIEDLKGKGVDVSGLVTLLSSAQNMLSQADDAGGAAGRNRRGVRRRRAVWSPGARLEASRTALSDPTALARLAHDVHIEQTCLLLLNGQVPGGDRGARPHRISVPLSITIPPIQNRFASAIKTSAVTRFSTRRPTPPRLPLHRRQAPAEGPPPHAPDGPADEAAVPAAETELLDSMLEQQDALVRGLSDWSATSTSRRTRYVEMHEKMDALLSTQRRQSSFTVRDIQSLEQWTRWSQVVFWILLASCGVMAVVHNYSAVSKTAEAIDAGIGRGACRCGGVSDGCVTEEGSCGAAHTRAVARRML